MTGAITTDTSRPLTGTTLLPGRTAEAREPAGPAGAAGAARPAFGVTPGRRRHLAAMAVVALTVFAATLAGARVFPGYSFDMRQYTANALVLDGESRARAVHDAAVAWCSGRASADAATRRIIPVLARDGRPDDQAQCVSDAAGWDTRVSPRYTAIFTARVGVAAMYAPFLVVFGTFWGMWVAAGTLAAAGGLLTAALVAAIGGSVRAAVAGQILFAVLPIGSWCAQPLSEGPIDVLVLIVLVGAALLLGNRRPRVGACLLVAGLVATIAAKESTATALCAGLLVAAGMGLTRPGIGTRRPATVLLLALAGVGAAGTAAWSAYRGDPGIAETLQELFTVCFTSPDVTHPWQRLLTLNQGFWLMEVRRQATMPFGIAALSVAGRLLWTKSSRAAPLLTVPVLIGIGTVCVHPHFAEAPRLLSTAWITCAVGLAMAVDRFSAVRSQTPTEARWPGRRLVRRPTDR
ncbi:hypothetical protein [Catenulispora yoronensis]